MTEEIKQRIKAVKAGKVPSGYKKTPIGILPDDWITDKTLGDIGVFGKGKGIPGKGLLVFARTGRISSTADFA